MRVVRAWISEGVPGMYSLSFRIKKNDPGVRLAELELPPAEPLNGHKLSLEQAQAFGVSERAYVLGLLEHGDLVRLHAAIGRFLSGEEDFG